MDLLIRCMIIAFHCTRYHYFIQRSMHDCIQMYTDLQVELVRVVQTLSRECPEQMQAASSALTQDELAVLTSALQLSTVSGTS